MEFKDQTIGQFLEALASSEPVPGGGAGAALAGALAASLLLKVVNLAKKRGRDTGSHGQRLEALVQTFFHLAQADAEAYSAVVQAQKIQEEEDDLEKALLRAAGVPLETAQKALSLLEIAEDLLSVCPRPARSDLACAARLAWAACTSALYNVDANARAVKDASFHEEVGHARQELADLAEEKAAFVLAPLEEELASWLGERDSNPH